MKALQRGRKALRPGPKPSLTVDRIAKEAIRVADAAGLPALSMERVARELDVTTMALYRYFPSKQKLLALMIDRVAMPGPDLPAAGTGWRGKLSKWTRACSAIYRKHPWLLEARLEEHRVMGPNELKWLDAALGILGEAGLSATEQHDLFLVLIGHVRSNAEFARANRRATSGEWEATTMKLIEERREEYPALAQALKSGAFRRRGSQSFDVRLECILNGIESLAQKQKNRRKTSTETRRS
jgi:AcrR family transcriptional regulator